MNGAGTAWLGGHRSCLRHRWAPRAVAEPRMSWAHWAGAGWSFVSPTEPSSSLGCAQISPNHRAGTCLLWVQHQGMQGQSPPRTGSFPKGINKTLLQ